MLKSTIRDQKSAVNHRRCGGFTLAEMLVSAAVLALIVLFVTRLTNHASAVITHGTKHMETESHVRPLFDRLAVDVAQMVKRTDVSYYLKNGGSGSVMGNGSTGVNDRMAFFTAAPGYYNDNGLGYNSRYSVVSYRANTDSTSASYNKVERMAKGLPLNAAYSAAVGTNVVTPLLFLAPGPGLPYTNPDSYNTTISNYWPAATALSSDPTNYYSSDSYQKYELIGPQVFRFEYYYLTSATPAALVAYPTTGFKDATLDWHAPNYINIKDVAAIVVAVAAIDPQSKKLLTDAQIQTLVTSLPDYSSGGPGALLAQWQGVLNGITNMPRPAIQSIRLYERYFYLNQ
jgi:prepilin-type N-terminal cleavage/methylation domain-containing protein